MKRNTVLIAAILTIAVAGAVALMLYRMGVFASSKSEPAETSEMIEQMSDADLLSARRNVLFQISMTEASADPQAEPSENLRKAKANLESMDAEIQRRGLDPNAAPDNERDR